MREVTDTDAFSSVHHWRQTSSAPNGRPDCASEACRQQPKVTYVIAHRYELTKSHEDTAAYNKFLILPMAFFNGTFFPVQRIPWPLQVVVWILPLSHTYVVIRRTSFDAEALVTLTVLVVHAVVFFVFGSRLIRNYSE